MLHRVDLDRIPQYSSSPPALGFHSLQAAPPPPGCLLKEKPHRPAIISLSKRNEQKQPSSSRSQAPEESAAGLAPGAKVRGHLGLKPESQAPKSPAPAPAWRWRGPSWSSPSLSTLSSECSSEGSAAISMPAESHQELEWISEHL